MMVLSGVLFFFQNKFVPSNMLLVAISVNVFGSSGPPYYTVTWEELPETKTTLCADLASVNQSVGQDA